MCRNAIFLHFTKREISESLFLENFTKREKAQRTSRKLNPVLDAIRMLLYYVSENNFKSEFNHKLGKDL